MRLLAGGVAWRGVAEDLNDVVEVVLGVAVTVLRVVVRELHGVGPLRPPPPDELYLPSPRPESS